jgi:hypothetical protein
VQKRFKHRSRRGRMGCQGPCHDGPRVRIDERNQAARQGGEGLDVLVRMGGSIEEQPRLDAQQRRACLSRAGAGEPGQARQIAIAQQGLIHRGETKP